MYIHSLSLIEKKTPESMNTFCWFSVKTRCQPQTQSWGEKKRNFQQRNVKKKKKKSPFVSDFTWTSFCRVEDDRRRKHAVFLNGEGQSHYCRTPTITSLLFFRCLEFGMSTPATAWKEDLRWIQHCCFCVWITAFRHQNSLGAKKQTCEILTRTGFIINFDCISYQLTAGNIAQHTQPV